jgi:hypothetical protein
VNKLRGPDGGVCFNWEVANRQSLSPCFSDDDDKQGVGVFPWKNALRCDAKSFHGFAFLTEEAAKQEGPAAIKSSFFFGR